MIQVTIQPVSWRQAESYLRAVRTAVFIEEQAVAPALEWDEMDADAVHVLALLDNQPIGCLRIIQYAKIGRMAVLSPWRGMGVGKRLLTKAIQICRMHHSKQIDLSAQTHAIPFYQQAGFQVTSEEYLDAQIPHVDMRLLLSPSIC